MVHLLRELLEILILTVQPHLALPLWLQSLNTALHRLLDQNTFGLGILERLVDLSGELDRRKRLVGVLRLQLLLCEDSLALLLELIVSPLLNALLGGLVLVLLVVHGLLLLGLAELALVGLLLLLDEALLLALLLLLLLLLAAFLRFLELLQVLHADRLLLVLLHLLDKLVQALAAHLEHDVFGFEVGVDDAAGLVHVDETGEHLPGELLDEPKAHALFEAVEMDDEVEETGSQHLEHGAVVLAMHAVVNEVVDHSDAIGFDLERGLLVSFGCATGFGDIIFERLL